MATVKPFSCIRPAADKASQVAALPYDVYNRAEAKAAIQGNEITFLRIDRAETTLDDSVDTYDPCVYQHAKELLDARIADGTFITDNDRCYYIYELIMDGRHQTGITARKKVLPTIVQPQPSTSTYFLTTPSPVI